MASTEAIRLWGDGVESVQVRVVTSRFPPFSRREEPDRGTDVEFFDLPPCPAGCSAPAETARVPEAG